VTTLFVFIPANLAVFAVAGFLLPRAVPERERTTRR
jgi:hypothetical protein